MPTVTGTETFTVTATDTLGATASTSYSVTVNSPPVLAGIESGAISYTEGDPATALTASITVRDIDNTTLAGATVWISGNCRNGEDIFSFVNTAKITNDWNVTTGTLTLTGSDTLADYQAALRSVTHVDISLNPSSATRIVSFEVNDGLADSNVLTRQITVTPVATWNGSASWNLSDQSNWVANMTPDPAVDELVLGGSAASTPFNDFPAGSEFLSLTLNGSCTLSGNSILLESKISNAQGNNSVSLPLVLGSDGLFQVSSGSLAVGGTIDNGGHLLTVNTAGASTATIGGSISGSGNLVKVGMGTLTLSGTNTYSGGTVVSAGTLPITNSDILPSGGSLTIGAGGILDFDSSLAAAVTLPAGNGLLNAAPWPWASFVGGSGR